GVSLKAFPYVKSCPNRDQCFLTICSTFLLTGPCSITNGIFSHTLSFFLAFSRVLRGILRTSSLVRFN
ncbi:hypothetical protein XELAEV_18002867mg, partial [Xenopus laevis]